jgi:hypothetical protein
MIFVFIGELTNWPNKMFPETGPKSFEIPNSNFNKFVSESDVLKAKLNNCKCFQIERNIKLMFTRLNDFF